MKIDNATRLLCVIGNPVAHSMSPKIHNFMINELGINYIYMPFEVKPGSLPEFLSAVKTLDIAGFNVTMPHKETIMPFLDTLSEDAKALGAVNTVSLRDGRLCGYNTDGEGFLRALYAGGTEVKGKNALILGAGGAAKAVTTTLYNAGAAKITVLNRDVDKADKLKRGREDLIFAHILNNENMRAHIRDCGLLVNCTPLGMHGTNAEYDDLSFFEAAPDGMAVCDLIYNPECTKFLKAARARGLKTKNGLGMLIHQAISALEIFTGIEIDAAEMSGKIKRILAK